MQLHVKKPQTSRNKVFRRKQKTSKATSKIFRGFEVGKKVLVVFPKPKNKTKNLKEHFQPLKTNNKVFLVYLQSKLQQDRYS